MGDLRVKFGVIDNDEETGGGDLLSPSHDENEFLPNTFQLQSIDTSAARPKSRRNLGSRMRSSTNRNKGLFRASTIKNLLSGNLSSHNNGEEKIKLLALHGKSSNGEVTKLQLANLGITDKKYEIVYLEGPIDEEEGDPEVTQLVGGPFHSWFYGNYSDARYITSFFEAVSHVIAAVHKLGPFDAVYGFSQGATVAAFVALAFEDAKFGKAVIDFNRSHEDEVSQGNRLSLRRSGNRGSILRRSPGNRDSILRRSPGNRGSILRPGMQSHHLQFETGSKGGSSQRHLIAKKHGSNRHLLSNYAKKGSEDVSQEFLDNGESFQYIVLACPVEDPVAIKTALRLEISEDQELIHIPSLHLIGSSDPRKAKSENMQSLFSDVQVKYMTGGHSIPRTVSSDKELLHVIRMSLAHRENAVEMEVPLMKRVSELTAMGLMSSIQVAHVELDYEGMEETLVKALSKNDRNKPLLRNARDPDETNYTTFGDVLDFIEGGPGDLRRLHVQDSEVVAYGAPPGGGAVPALAFLSIMAQTTAAPLAPGSQESDAIYFCEQFNAKHLVLFEGVECPGVEAAFEKYAASGKATLHRASIRVGGKPGLFDYTHTGSTRLDKNWLPSKISKSITNPPDGVGLLLGTSGTTSKPKGVPILQSSLVQNGYIIASCLNLREDDTCYSIMPLFHIGGISASILCSIAAGGSICCDDRAYNPENMIDALALSNPQPTWYSSVPTIHNATVSFIRDMAGSSEKLRSYGISEDGVWKEGHSLRMIRSGAAALLGPDALNLSTTYGQIPIIPTYSMSEQMPISQPPAGKSDMIIDKPGSVGVPVAGSLAIVDSNTLKPLPFGKEGEIAISGSTVINNYLNNGEADRKAYFQLTLPVRCNTAAACNRFFLTGDVGVLDKDGFLSLKGRNKELIKKGGEQISPFEIEEPLLDHPWVETAICFAVPSQLYGEEAGIAIVLSANSPADATLEKMIKELRVFLQKKDVSPLKWPTKWKIVEDEELPKTKTKKYIRVGLAKHLNLEEEEHAACPLVQKKKPNNTFIDWDVITGFRFLLACYVMFMHIGANSSWGAFNNLRGWPWHVHVFFTLGGYSLAAPMNPVIEKKFKYFLARISAMYPMYAVALIFVFVNLLVTCRPSTFRSDFHWDGQPDDLYIDGDETKGVAPLFCEGTPATPNSYWASLFLTILVYITGSAITPVYFLNWWMGYYFWFSAMYYQCLMIFPALYNRLANYRSNVKVYFYTLISLLLANLVLLLTTWFVSKDYEGYNHYDESTGEANDVGEYEDASAHNATILSWYLFSPFWMLYFVIGAVTAFLYDAYRPGEKNNTYIWGYVADGCTLLMVIWSICLICQDGNGNHDNGYALRPDEGDRFTDTAVTSRLWDNICGRLIAPLTTTWVFALSTGEGWTASILRTPFYVEVIAPHAYNCFLFHQPVGQWYLAATRQGHWWNWWRYRKTMYWFSPSPVPVEWYEYFYVVILTVGFSALMNVTAMPFVSGIINLIGEVVFGVSNDDDDIDMEDALIVAIEDMTGFAPELDWTLDQCGLSSVGLPQLAARLQKGLSSKTTPIPVSAASLGSARTVGDIVDVLYQIKEQAEADGI